MSRPVPQRFRDAFRGLARVAASQPNLRIHAFMGFTAFGAAWIEQRPPWTDAVVALAVGLVIGLEAMNSAVESLVNLAHPAWDEAAGRIKDMAAAAVLVASLGALAAGVVMFGPGLSRLPQDLSRAWTHDRAALVLWCTGFAVEFVLAFVVPSPRSER